MISIKFTLPSEYKKESDERRRGDKLGDDNGERFAVISDIHGNLEALLAVLDDINMRGIDKVFCVGDLVGYGPNPNEVVNIIRKEGIPSVLGNHDYAVNNPGHLKWFNNYARKALEWTINELSDRNKEFLKDLPTIYNEDRHFVMLHGSPRDPVFEYILPYKTSLIEKSSDLAFEKFGKNILIVGHTHVSLLYVKNKNQDTDGRVYYFFLPPIQGRGDKEIPTFSNIITKTELNYSGEENAVDTAKFYINRDEGLRVLLNPGSVGQPRDHCSKSSYSILEVNDKEIVLTFVRVPYNVKNVSDKIVEKGLPGFLGERLHLGR